MAKAAHTRVATNPTMNRRLITHMIANRVFTSHLRRRSRLLLALGEREASQDAPLTTCEPLLFLDLRSTAHSLNASSLQIEYALLLPTGHARVGLLASHTTYTALPENKDSRNDHLPDCAPAPILRHSWSPSPVACRAARRFENFSASQNGSSNSASLLSAS